MGILVALAGGVIVYGGLKAVMDLRLDEEAEYNGADISIHNISATPEKQPVL